MSSRFRLYIDESGDHTYQNLGPDSPHRYLALLGIWYEHGSGSAYESFAVGLRELKERVFGMRPDDPVILHRKELMDRRGVFSALRDPGRARVFDEGLLELLRNTPFTVCCVLIDKYSHAGKTYRSLYHPYHYSLAALLERYAGRLYYEGTVGDVMVESRGATEDRELQRAFDSLRAAGTRYFPARRFRSVLTSKKLKLKKKEAAIPGLELADLLANPVRREMICEAQLEDPPTDDFGARLVDAARGRFNRQLHTGRVKGYGKVFLT